ncbi:MAG: DUF4011 domain-containing protein [Holosporales bacterium]|nr:DUF4011 domain-containing protein [Holosporales bacterium]
MTKVAQIQTQNESVNSFVKECVEKYRCKLLDMSRRNALISFSHSERSHQHIRIINELPDFLYEKFLEGETFTFLALPEESQIPSDEQTHTFISHLEQAKLTDLEYIEAIKSIKEDEEGALDKIKLIERGLKNRIREVLNLPIWKERKSMTNVEIAMKFGLNPSYEMPNPTPENQEKITQRDGKFIQSLLTPEEMSRKLNGLVSYIHSDIEETGVNTLYSAFGFLQWYESENSDRPCVSPLLLLQLEIERKQSRSGYTYRVQATGEDPEINLSLSERLKADFGMKLPELIEEEMPECYMAKIADLIRDAQVPQKEKWCVKRFITIGRFGFSRLVMFHDLSEKKWQNGVGIPDNKIVQHLFAGSEESTDTGYAEDYDIDTPEVEEIVPILITSADASQHSAIVDVMKGKNLAITGPPGTGKSQTITNIIACALAKGKTVLFLAEKMAALNVVYERLSKANLGPYCLAIHSTKAKKIEVLKSIKERLDIYFCKSDDWNLDSKLREFKRHKNCITEYIDALNSPFGCQGKTIHEYLWAAQLRKDHIGDLFSTIRQIKLPFEQVDLTESELMEHTDDLKSIVLLKEEIDKAAINGHHPWDFVGNTGLNPFQLDELKQLVANLKEQFEKTKSAFTYFSEHFGLSVDYSVRDFDRFLNETEILVNAATDNINLEVIAKLDSRENIDALLKFVENIQIYRSAQKEIRTLKDISASTALISDIEAQIMSAEELKCDSLAVSGIELQIRNLKEELELCDKLLEIGKRFGISKNDDVEKVHILMEILDCVTSVPRTYLITKTEDIMEEINTERLKNAAGIQKRVRDFIDEHKANYDFSIMGQPQEIRSHIIALTNAGLFALLTPAYQKAKKFLAAASKCKTKFNVHAAVEILREIADIKEEQQKIERDVQLQMICGSSFNGIDTDFEKLIKINKWATGIRERYAAKDEFARNICQWILTASIEELDSVRNITKHSSFATLKAEIAAIKSSTLDMPIENCFDDFKDRIARLSGVKNTLQNIAASKSVTFAEIVVDLPNLQKIAETEDAIKNNTAARVAMGNLYADVNTDIQYIERTVEFIKNCLAVPEVASNLSRFFHDDFVRTWQEFIEGRLLVKNQQIVLKDLFTKSCGQLSLCLSVRFGVDNWENVSYGDFLSLFATALEKSDSLGSYIEFNSRLAKTNLDLKGVLLAVYDREKLDFTTLPLAFEYMIYRNIACEIYNRYPKLSSAKGLELDKARTRIKELDSEILLLQKQRLSNILSEARPLPGIGNGRKSGWTEGALIRNELSKRRGHISIRHLMERAGLSIQAIKPCFLMSPLTVAQYLDPKKTMFDLIIIDEASQMRLENALGGISRAKQIVVVGDQQQLPPTSFFQFGGMDGDTEEEEDFTSEAVMDLALSSFRPPRILNRHYRSRHESLIAFSNRHFYDDGLVLFPSPIKNPHELGIKLEYVGGCYAAKSNMDEVQAIVKAALDFMRKHPDRSLGIATMNQVQKELIEMEMDRAFVEHPHAHKYRTKWQSTLESFFVKNLESVQGDERDAIFISTVYGPDKDGVVMQRFGPINSAHGHRRLNVLFTRAKKNMVIFTSLKPEDIKISENSSQGAKALKNFLIYAFTGVIDAGEETRHDLDSDFEMFVKERLESIGYEVHPQVGVAGYRIDLGVKHPKYQYGYLVGVECDGATYHSSKSARERDVIRQQVLEGLGWRIYRIWSTDWFYNSTREFEKLKTYIEKLLNPQDMPD